MQTIDAWRPDLIVRDSVEYASAVAAERAGRAPCPGGGAHGLIRGSIPALAAGPLDELRRDAGLPPSGAGFLSAEPVFSAFPASTGRGVGRRGAEPSASRRMREDAPGAAPASGGPPDDRGRSFTSPSAPSSVARRRSAGSIARRWTRSRPARQGAATTGRGMEEGTLGTIPANVHVEEWVPQREVLARERRWFATEVPGPSAAHWPPGFRWSWCRWGGSTAQREPHRRRRCRARRAGPDAASLSAAVARVLGDAEFARAARRIADEIAARAGRSRPAVPAMVAMADG